MTESARASWGARRWVAMSAGKSVGQARRQIARIPAGSASSSAAAVRRADARTSSTIRSSVASSSGACSWVWIGAAGSPGSASSMRRRSTTV